MTKIGVQLWPTEPALRFLRMAGGRMPHLKILDPQFDWPAAYEAIRRARENRRKVIVRFVKFFDDRSWSQNPADHFRELYEGAFRNWPRELWPDGIELFNEPGTDPASWGQLGSYYSRAVPLWLEAGLRPVLYNVSTGTPDLSLGLRAPLLQGALYGAHEYLWCYRAGEISPDSERYHLGRYRAWVPNFRVPVLITETGVEPGGYRKWGIPLHAAMERIDAFYADKEQVRCAFWFALGDPTGHWTMFDPKDELENLIAYYDRHPVRDFDLEEIPMDHRIWRGIDISAYSGPIPAEAARRLATVWGIRVAVVQLWGGSPCGVGPNRWAFQQAHALDEAGIRVGFYVWPPGEIDQALPLLKVFSRPVQFVALDVESASPVRREHIDRIRSAGFTPVIYSSPSQWFTIMRNTTAFADVDYWEANYIRKFRNWLGQWNGQWPTEADHPWTPVAKGGWNYSFGWQFFGTTRLEGISVDLNVFDAQWGKWR